MPETIDRAMSSAQAPPRLLQELRETLQRLRLGGPFYVLLWLLAGAAANLWQRFPVAFIAISLGFIGLTVVRFRVRGLPDDSNATAVRGRLDYIWLLLLVNAALWGAASAWLLLVAPEESARTVAAISSYAFATAFAHNFPMRLRLQLLHAAVQLQALFVGLGRIELETDRQHGVVRVQVDRSISLHPDETKDE